MRSTLFSRSPLVTLAVTISTLAFVGPANGDDMEAHNGITAHVSDDTPAYGASVRVFGKVTNRAPGAKIRLTLVGDGGSARTVATATLNEKRRYSMWWTPPAEEIGSTHVLQVVAVKTAKKPAAAGHYFYVAPEDAPWDPRTERPKFLKIVNDARAERGLAPLTMVPEYTRIANGIAKELYDNGGSMPENSRWNRFGAKVYDVGMCEASNVGRNGYQYTAQEFDFEAGADFFAVGVYQQPNGRASFVMYTLGEVEQGS